MSATIGKPWPADKIEIRPIDKLVPYARNPRSHSEEQISQIAASIREFGWTNPVIIDDNGMILAGHGRVLAAERLGMTQVPVIEVRHLTEEQKRAYVLADNKIAENSFWDSLLLTTEISELADIGLDLFSAGFDDEEIKRILGTQPTLREENQELRPKRFVRALVSVPIERADEAKPLMDQLSGIRGVTIDYGAN